MNESNIKEIVSEIIAGIEELKNLTTLGDYENGQLIAYIEALSIIQSACAGYDLSKIGLDFDVDKKYL